MKPEDFCQLIKAEAEVVLSILKHLHLYRNYFNGFKYSYCFNWNLVNFTQIETIVIEHGSRYLGTLREG